jgi:hypothetical protein
LLVDEDSRIIVQRLDVGSYLAMNCKSRPSPSGVAFYGFTMSSLPLWRLADHGRWAWPILLRSRYPHTPPSYGYTLGIWSLATKTSSIGSHWYHPPLFSPLWTIHCWFIPLTTLCFTIWSYLLRTPSSYISLEVFPSAVSLPTLMLSGS